MLREVGLDDGEVILAESLPRVRLLDDTRLVALVKDPQQIAAADGKGKAGDDESLLPVVQVFLHRSVLSCPKNVSMER
jgi:hypothetical protein